MGFGRVGPVNHERPTLEIAAGNRAPKARVVGVIPVVPHAKDVTLRHLVGAVKVTEPAIVGEVGRGGQNGGVFENRPGVVFRLAVDVELFSADFHPIATHGHRPLDEVPLGILGELEDHHVSPLHVPVREQAVQRGVPVRRVNELVDEQMVANEQVVLHGPGGDLEGLHHKGAGKKRKGHRHQDGLVVLAKNPVFLHPCASALTGKVW
ncbi:hypothetical protein HRbin09_00001 [bacterium HR09]|nr:hypothetical protein HRbin09_00001 [bacterium HR09]